MAKRKRSTKKKFRSKKRGKGLSTSTQNTRDADVVPYPSMGRNLTSFIPPKLKVTLRYGDSGVLTGAGIGLPAVWQFRANSIFDPDYTNVGHSVRGEDQYHPMYKAYQVIGSKITVIFHGSGNPHMVGIGLGATSTSLPGTKWDCYEFDPANSVMGSTTTDTDVALNFGYSQKKMFGTSELDGSYNAITGGNPAVNPMFNVWIKNVSDLATSSLYVTVIIDYIVIFTEPKSLAVSA